MVSVTKVVSAWGRSRHPTATGRAEQLVSRIEALAAENNRPDLRPNEYTYNALINCFARRGMASKAEEYLQVVKDKPGLEADTVTYNSVINAHATNKRNAKAGAERALELLEEMKSLSGEGDGNNAKVRPDAITYGSVIKCLTDQLLTELEGLYEESGGSEEERERLAPNTILYNSVLDAYASIRGGGGIARAEALLDAMEERRAQGYANGAVSPDAFTFSSLIKAWTSASSSGNKKKKSDDDEDCSDRRGPSAAERAQQLLERMEELHRAGDDNVKPTTVVYNSVIAAWAKSGEAGAAERAEELLARMQQIAKASGGDDDAVRADTISYNSAIDAWARADEYGAAERAEALLDSMERQYVAGNDDLLKPDVRSFNACINAWARTGGPGAGLRAEQLLDRLEALHDETPGDGDEALRPTRITYATVIHAHARSFKKGCGEAAEAILDHMEELFEEEEGMEEARPNPVAFNAVLKAWQNSEAGLSPPRAEGLLLRMVDYVDRDNGREIRDANDTFDLAVRILDATYDKDAIERIEALRSGLNG